MMQDCFFFLRHLHHLIRVNEMFRSFVQMDFVGRTEVTQFHLFFLFEL